MNDQEYMLRVMARFESQGDKPLSDERMLGRLEGRQMQIEYDLYRIDNLGLTRTRNILESELNQTDMLIEFQIEQMRKGR